jgi:8-oxo-dGTP diphosphatase
MPHEFQVSAKGILVKDGKALILKGCLASGGCFWDLPGGRMEKGESIEQGLKREVIEELPSLELFTIIKLLYAHAAHHVKDKQEMITLFYVVSGQLSEIRLSQEHSEYRWVNALEIDRLAKETGHRQFAGHDIAIKRALE